MPDDPIILLFFIKNLSLGLKDIELLIYKKCFQYVRIEPYYHETYFHNDFAGGEDYVNYKAGLVVRQLKRFDISVNIKPKLNAYYTNNISWDPEYLLILNQVFLKNTKHTTTISSDLGRFSCIRKNSLNMPSRKEITDKDGKKTDKFNVSLGKKITKNQGSYCVWDIKTNKFEHLVKRKYALCHIRRDHCCTERNCTTKLIKVYIDVDSSTVHIYKNNCDNYTDTEYLRIYYGIQ
jgi:hypothetical protein